MRKIPSLFERNWTGALKDRSLCIPEVTKDAAWVLGEPEADYQPMIKWDGTPVMVRAGRLFKRFDAKRGKTPPSDFIPCQDPDFVTGHWPGWVRVTDGPEDKALNEAFRVDRLAHLVQSEATYECIGPKINGNPYSLGRHMLVNHNWPTVVPDITGLPPGQAFTTLFEFLRTYQMAFYDRITYIEGIVWHHRDGRMAKVKRKDFGLAWPLPVLFTGDITEDDWKAAIERMKERERKT